MSDIVERLWESDEASALTNEAAREITRLRNLRDTLKLEAQIHAGEAKGANSTIYEIYQVITGATGEPGNWNGAVPVREAITALRSALSTAKADGIKEGLERAAKVADTQAEDHGYYGTAAADAAARIRKMIEEVEP